MSNSTASESDNRQRPGPPGPPPHPYPTPPPPPPRHLRPPPPPHALPPKRKKKKVPPQEAVDQIWARFSAPKFSRATALLPGRRDATTLAQEGSRNVLVSEDYERAVADCRVRVEKLIRECKRVNMRYRDPDFDLDWDLKWEKGHCLNGLGENRFDLQGRAPGILNNSMPKAVKRVHEIFEEPSFLGNSLRAEDVRQGGVGDCWLMASLTALVGVEEGIKRICAAYDTKIGIYGFVFHRDGEWITTIIDDKLYLKSPDWDSRSVQRHLLEQTDREDVEAEYRKMYQTGSDALYFAHCKDSNETWLPILEKAFAKAHGDYQALIGGWIGEGLEDLTGGVTTELLTSDILDINDFWTDELLRVNKEFLFGCSTGLLDIGYGNRDGISEGHAYVVMEARQISNGERLLKLRNPWGKGKKGNWEGPWSDGSKEFTPEFQIELNHKFGNDSVFWISYKDFLRKYQHFDRTRLFMDPPDWRITQKWLSVDVPWKADFERRFKFVVTQQTPIVLVLSQLDERYFYGLEGQYTFRLQFRIHEVGTESEEDHILRSHGNYMMQRSVVTELKSLSAGTYAVSVMVTAERIPNSLAVEQVIKNQTRRKVDNFKLAQVGAAYDAAHEKVAAYIEAKKAKRTDLDKAKAKKARIELRYKNWERRALQRVLLKKQADKNRKKSDQDALKNDEQTPEGGVTRASIAFRERACQTEGVDQKSGQVDKGCQTVVDVKPEPSIMEQPTNELAPNEKSCQTGFNHMNRQADSSNTTPITPKSDSESYSHYSPQRRRSVHARYPPRPYREEIHDRYRAMSPERRPGLRQAHYVRRGSPDSRYQESPHVTPPHPASFRALPHHQRPVPRRHNNGNPPMREYYSSNESSASPLSDFDDLHSDEDPTLRPRPLCTTGETSKRKQDSSSDEGSIAGPNVPQDRQRPGTHRRRGDKVDVERWNAVCVLGMRVYSRDAGLELTICEVEEDPEQVRVSLRKTQKEQERLKVDSQHGGEVGDTSEAVHEAGDTSSRIESGSQTNIVLADGEKSPSNMGRDSNTRANSETSAPETIHPAAERNDLLASECVNQESETPAVMRLAEPIKGVCEARIP